MDETKIKKMQPSEALARMKELSRATVPELKSGHIEADRVLCELLNHLGQIEVVEQFKRVAKEY